MKKTKKLLIPLAICLCSPAALAQSSTTITLGATVVETFAHSVTGQNINNLEADAPGSFEVDVTKDSAWSTLSSRDICLTLQATSGALIHSDEEAMLLIGGVEDIDDLDKMDLVFACDLVDSSGHMVDEDVISFEGADAGMIDYGAAFESHNGDITISCEYDLASTDLSSFNAHNVGSYSDIMNISVTDSDSSC